MSERSERPGQHSVFGSPELNALDRTWSADLDIRLTDTCLRDGSHHKRHQFTGEEVRSVIALSTRQACPSSR